MNRFNLRSALFVVLFLLLVSYSCSDNSSGPVDKGPAPVINGIQPDSGKIGTAVTINGKNFSTKNEENNVTFNNVDADIVSASETQLDVTVPQGATTGSVQVSVNGKSSGEVNFIVTSAPGEPDYNYQSDYKYNLNVIYFVPNDLQAKDNWHERLSKFLLFYQDYYKKWMRHWGYTDKTFGLLKDNDKEIVKITYIEGDHPASYYPNSVKGAQHIQKKVRNYFSADPQLQATGKSWMVYIPRPIPHPAAGLPYFGLGRWAFVEDHNQQPVNVRKVGGGDAHELGHALGLQHNAEPLPEREKLGNALMHNGNHIWNRKAPSYGHNGSGPSHVSLTQVDAEILNVAQLTSKTTGSFYGKVNAKLKEATGTHKNGNIIISGEYTSDVPVTSAAVMLNPAGSKGYSRVGFVDKNPSVGKFKLNISKDRLLKTDNHSYSVLLWLIHKNGKRVHFSLPDFSFKNGIPDIDFHVGPVNTISKSGWRIIDYSDQANTTGKVAANIIDGDFGTWWHNDFTIDKGQPHSLTVDMSEKHNVQGFQFVQVGSAHKNSRVKELDIKVSQDGKNYEKLGRFTLNNSKQPQQVKLSSTKSFRYFKLVTQSSWGNLPKAASIAEVGVY